MSQKHDLFTLLHSTLIPKLGDFITQHPEFLELTTSSSLTLDKLNAIEANTYRFRLDRRASQGLSHLIWARRALTALETKPFTAALCETFLSNLLGVFEHYSDELDMEISLTLGMVCILEGIASAQSWRDVALFVLWCKKISGLPQAPSTQPAQALAEAQFEHFFWSGLGGTTSEDFEKQIDAIRDLDSLSIDIDYEAVRETCVRMTLLSLDEPELDPAAIRRVLGKLKQMAFTDQSLLDTLDILVQQYGFEEAQPPPGPPSICVPNEIPPEPRPVITQKSELLFDARPLFAQGTRYPKLYVYSAKTPRNAPAAVKEYVSDKKQDFENMALKELEILKRFSGVHETFLKFYGGYLNEVANPEPEYEFGIVMELGAMNLMEDLSTRSARNAPFAVNLLNKHFTSLLHGLSILHANQVYHQDIKPHNILVTSDGTLKFIDFNISVVTRLDKSQTMNLTDLRLIQGTDGYLPPELCAPRNRGADKALFNPAKIDVYGLGLTFLQMITLQSVKDFSLESAQPQLQQVLDGLEVSWMRSMLQEMLCFDPANRTAQCTELLRWIPGTDKTIINS